MLVSTRTLAAVSLAKCSLWAQSRLPGGGHFGHVTIAEMASGGGGRLKSYKPLFKDIEETRREREEAGVQLRRRKRDEEVGARLLVSSGSKSPLFHSRSLPGCRRAYRHRMRHLANAYAIVYALHVKSHKDLGCTSARSLQQSDEIGNTMHCS